MQWTKAGDAEQISCAAISPLKARSTGLKYHSPHIKTAAKIPAVTIYR